MKRIILSTLVMGVILFGACAQPAPVPRPAPTPVPAPAPPQAPPSLVTGGSTILLEDSSYLQPFDEVGYEKKYTSLPLSDLPFSEFGMYISKPFFLNVDEVAEVVIISSELPIGFEHSPGPEYRGGLFVLLEVFGGKGQEGQLQPESTDLFRKGNDWVGKAIYPAPDLIGPCYIFISNSSGLPRNSTTGTGIPTSFELTVFVSKKS